jgi:hypothetical protein
MPPKTLSRHIFSFGIRDPDLNFMLSDREPFRFRDRRDNIVHTARRGDTLFTLAGSFYRSIDPDRACGLWWILADYQPDPVVDPTVKLAVGVLIYAPSPRVVIQEIFSESRRRET